MLRVAMTYVRDPNIAEDIVQETWLTCLRRLKDFEARSSLKTWIFGILINVARARQRKESRVIPFAAVLSRLDDAIPRPTVDQPRFGNDGMWRAGPDSWEGLPESTLIGQETFGQVRAAIDDLPSSQRQVIVLRDVVGLDAGEVSSMLRISEGNQRVRLHRARAAVRKKLEEYLR